MFFQPGRCHLAGKRMLPTAIVLFVILLLSTLSPNTGAPGPSQVKAAAYEFRKCSGSEVTNIFSVYDSCLKLRVYLSSTSSVRDPVWKDPQGNQTLACDWSGCMLEWYNYVNGVFVSVDHYFYISRMNREVGLYRVSTAYGFSSSFQIISPPNTAPTLSGLPDQVVSGNANNAIDLWAYAVDAESTDSDLTFTMDNTPALGAGVSIDGDRYIDINPTSGWTGQTTVVVRVTDPGGLSNTDTFNITVTNAAPTLSSLPDQTLPMNSNVDAAIDLWAYADDIESDDNELTFVIDNTSDSNAGVSIDGNRYIDINPTTGWTGQTDLTIRVTDPGNRFDTDTFNVTVARLWNGSVSSDWHTVGNWTPNGEPTSDNDVIISDEAVDPIISAGNAAVHNLTINEGAVLSLINRSLTVEGMLINNGTLEQTQDIAPDEAAEFLRITNLTGDQIRYYGVDIIPSGTADATNAPQDNTQQSVTVSVSGNQFCAERTTGVKRCFDIASATAMNATVRFYFGEAERNCLTLDDLLVFRQSDDWVQELGPYTRGGIDDAQYIEIENVDNWALFALDSEDGGGCTCQYLPLALKDSP